MRCLCRSPVFDSKLRHDYHFISNTTFISRCSLLGTAAVELQRCVQIFTVTSYAFFQPEEGGNKPLRNICNRPPDYTVSQSMGPRHTFSPLRKTCISFSTPLCGQANGEQHCAVASRRNSPPQIASRTFLLSRHRHIIPEFAVFKAELLSMFEV